jgi:hypothetical protein
VDAPRDATLLAGAAAVDVLAGMAAAAALGEDASGNLVGAIAHLTDLTLTHFQPFGKSWRAL